MEKKKEKCQQRIKELYNLSCRELTLEDKKIFCLPIRYRLKLGYSAMRQWIELAEHIFQQRMTINEKKKLSWYFPIQVRKDEKDATFKKHTPTEEENKDNHIKTKNQIQTKLNFKITSQRPRGG